MNKVLNQPLVSVIIACKNTAEYFDKCLQSVINQTYSNIEIIVVDNFSTDGTYEIAQKYTSVVYQVGPERSTQFNYGFKHSKGELIYRIGPDYVLERDVVEKCVQKIQEGYDALALHNRSVGESIWAKVRYLERESYVNDQQIVAVRFFKREVFQRVGMFDESLVANEDFDLHNRIVQAGYKWTHVDAIENHIGEPKNIIDVRNKFHYYGRTIGRYMKKSKQTGKKHMTLFRPSFRKIQAELIRNPKLMVAFYVYFVVKGLAGITGFLRGAPKSLVKNKV
ncbi:MAG: glycosyltransferase family A protein [Patescibacteria group bacterium]